MGDMSATFSANQGGRSQRPPVIFLMGPTASGKTDLAVSLMERMDCELISVDSALIYRGMDIGTAKPDPAMLEKAPHALIDILDPWESYSVADFYSDALAEIQRIHSNGKIPILVGGTMMYFRVLRDGIAALPSADDAVRERINADALAHGWPYIHEQLRQVDPDSAARIKPNDAQRLQRALEVFRVSGKTMTEFWAQQSERTSREIAHSEATHDQMETGKAENSDYTKLSESPALEAATDLPLDAGLSGLPFPIVSLAIAPAERSVLHDRIERRYLSMLDQGFVDEVRGLKANSKIERAMPSMRCVGYRQVWDFLEGDVDFETSKFKGIVATRQLAKRQLTWLRSWSGLHWLDTFDKNVLDKALNIIKKDA